MTPGELRAALGRLRRAQRNAQSAELAPLFDMSGHVYFRLGNYQEAIDAHRNAARYDKYNAAYPNNVACCLTELGRFSQALEALRDASARPIKPSGLEVAISLNIAEAHHHLGDFEASRRAYAEALRNVSLVRPGDMLAVAGTAATMGAEDDAVEFFARALAVARGVELGENPAIEFVRADPDHLKVARAKSRALENAILQVGARYDNPPPPEHALTTQIILPEATFRAFLEMIDHAPEPT